MNGHSDSPGKARNGVVTWENKRSPTGALTPAGPLDPRLDRRPVMSIAPHPCDDDQGVRA